MEEQDFDENVIPLTEGMIIQASKVDSLDNHNEIKNNCNFQQLCLFWLIGYFLILTISLVFNVDILGNYYSILLFPGLMSIFTFVPCALSFQGSINSFLICSSKLGFIELNINFNDQYQYTQTQQFVCISSWSIWCGMIIGAIFAVLDWDNKWKYYPQNSFYSALIGLVFVLVIKLILYINKFGRKIERKY